MMFTLGDVFRRKGPRGKCVKITGCTAHGGLLVRPCNPDGTDRGAGRGRLMWPQEFDRSYVNLSAQTRTGVGLEVTKEKT